MERPANKFADWLVENGAPSDNREIFAYAVECLLNTILIFGIIIAIGAILNRFLITIIWILFFLPIRHVSGGLHAPNHIGCLIFSVAVGVACILIPPIMSGLWWLIYVGIIASITIVFAFAPVIHTNHPLSEKRIQKMKKSARILIVIESALIILLFTSAIPEFSYAALLGVLAATISTLIGHFNH